MGQINQPTNMLDELVQLKREVRELRKAVGLNSASITSGRLRVANGAEFEVQHVDGEFAVFYVGQGGSDRYTIQMRRDDGSNIFGVGGNPGQPQFWAWRDRNGTDAALPTIVVSDDALSGWGLANPRVAGAMYNSRLNLMHPTTVSSYEEIQRGRFRAVNPYVEIDLLVSAEASTSGTARILIDNVERWTHTINPGFGQTGTGKLDVYTGRDFGDVIDIRLELRRDSGAGNVKCGVIGVYGSQS